MNQKLKHRERVASTRVEAVQGEGLSLLLRRAHVLLVFGALMAATPVWAQEEVEEDAADAEAPTAESGTTDGQDSALHVQARPRDSDSSVARRVAATIERQFAISAMRRVIISLSAMMVACGLTALGLGKMLASTT